MQILFINNQGAGFADKVEISPDTSIASFIGYHFGDNSSKDLTIRVNRDNVPADYILQEGDKVSVTPNKIDGA